MKRAEILDTARQAVTVDRAATHGQAEDTFGRIAAVWSARLGIEITPDQVCIMLVDLKTCRAWGNPGHPDNWVDMAGYAACGGEIATGAPSRPIEEPKRWRDDDGNCTGCGAPRYIMCKPECPNLAAAGGA